MPRVAIEGREISVAEGTTVLQAAEQLGVEIPRLCYHPCLSIAGNCRMCLVEIEKNPRPQTACSTPVTEGMVVHVNSEKAKAARRAVVELLLLSHPCNCTICDKAGECLVQNNAMEQGLLRRVDKPPRIEKPSLIDMGRHILLSAGTCIACTRCVRFVDEITRTHEIGIFGRSNAEVLGLAPGKRLDNPYSGCTVDLCPVGALTAKDFRFQSRAWFLEKTNSICPSCARGCNITIEGNLNAINKIGQRRIYRLRPRYNAEVNGHWMCDEGRFRYRFIDENRVLEPLLREGGRERELAWEEAMAEFKRFLDDADPKRLGVLLSRGSSLEDLFLAREFFSRHLKGARVTTDAPAGRPPTEDDFLIRGDKWPNTAGALLLGMAGPGAEWVEILRRSEKRELDVLVVVGHDLAEMFPMAEVPAALHWPKHVIALDSNWTDAARQASLVLPLATFAEREGTYVNSAGRVQRFTKAVEPLGEARPEWRIWRDLLGRYGTPQLLSDEREVFGALARRVRALKGLSYEAIGDGGTALKLPREKKGK